MKDINRYIEDIFKNRYTCKGYDPDKKVSDEDFHTILEAGRLSPSSLGYEPWKFVLIRNKELLEELRPYSWGAHRAFDGASHIVFILARVPEDMKPDSEYLYYIQNDIQNFPPDLLKDRVEKYRKFQDVDFKLSESDRALFDWTCKQTYIPFTNMLTVAAMLGIDSTPIEGFEQDKVHEILVEHEVYDPKHFKIANMIAFGYTNTDHRVKTRRSMEEVFEVFE
ncbi:MAG: NAD(P)H-dependent oxidoreductase [Tissierellia bacterium]|nr:NAD(P)H-dependent oxidoreductase [Tissierellia bacterium]